MLNGTGLQSTGSVQTRLEPVPGPPPSLVSLSEGLRNRILSLIEQTETIKQIIEPTSQSNQTSAQCGGSGVLGTLQEAHDLLGCLDQLASDIGRCVGYQKGQI